MSGASVRDALDALGTDSVAAAAADVGLSRPISVRDLLLAIRPTAYVWRGFEHAWEYNHRLNRFGSYVRPARVDEDHEGWFVGHAAASGSGDDIASFEDYYTGVNAPGVGFATGVVVLPIDTTETTRATVQQTVGLDIDGPYLDGDEYAVLLNGFDVVASKEADKLMRLDLRVGEPAVRDDCLTFDLTCEFTADCHTPECGSGGATDYMLVARYLVVAGDADAFDATRDSATVEYGWDRETELPNARGNAATTVANPSAGAPGRRTMGFNRIAIDLERGDEPPLLDIGASNGVPAALEFGPLNRLAANAGVPIHGEAMHLLEWDTAVLDVDCEDDDCEARLRLFFKNWRESMYQADYPDQQALRQALLGHLNQIDTTRLKNLKNDLGAIPKSFGSLRDAGRARIEAGLTLLRFRDTALFAPGSRADRLYWPGSGRPAAGEQAVREDRLADRSD